MQWKVLNNKLTRVGDKVGLTVGASEGLNVGVYIKFERERKEKIIYCQCEHDIEEVMQSNTSIGYHVKKQPRVERTTYNGGSQCWI